MVPPLGGLKGCEESQDICDDHLIQLMVCNLKVEACEQNWAKAEWMFSIEPCDDFKLHNESTCLSNGSTFFHLRICSSANYWSDFFLGQPGKLVDAAKAASLCVRIGPNAVRNIVCHSD